MASIDRIDSIYDIGALTEQQRATENLVKKTIAQIKAAKKESIDFNINTKSLADYNKRIKELEKSLGGLQKSTNEATKASILLAKQKQAEAKAAEAVAKAATAETKAKQAQSKESANLSKQQANESKIVDQVIDDYLQLSKAYNDAALRAKNYALRLGETHPVTIEAVKDANDMANTLKRLDASVGQNQRNVGNYKSAFDGLGFSFTQISRELPSLSISFQQFALAVSNNLPMVADEIAKTKKEIAALRAEGKEAPSLLSKIGKSLLSWQVGLSVGIALLTAYAGQLKDWVVELVSGKKNTDALAESQKKLAEAIRDVNAARQDSIRYNTEAYDSESVLLKRNLSISEAAGEDELKLIEMRVKIAQRRKELADNEVANQIDLAEREKATQELQKTGLEALKTGIETAEIEYFQYTDAIIRLSDQRVKALVQEEKSQVKSLEKQIEAAKAGQAAAKDRADAYRNSLQAQVDADTELAMLAAQAEAERQKRAKEAAEKSKALRERDADADYETQRANIELDKEFDLIRAENEKLDYTARLQALYDFGLDSQRLIDLQADHELSKADLTAKERIRIQNDRNNELIRLSQELADKMAKLTEREFEVDTSGLGDLVKGLPAEIQKALDEFKKAQDKAIKDHKDALDQLKKNTKDAIVGLASELEGLFFDIFTNQIERQKNAVQEQIDLLEAQKQKDIEVANQSITNAADRADAIAIIEARAAAKRQQLEARQRQLDQQKARFEKARAVTEIVQSTALAVVNALSQVKTLGPGAIALAAIIGALGAIQIARVLAQPIPKYKEGTENHPGGPMIVGDGGRSEGIQLPDGSVYKSPATDTLMTAPAGTKVFKDYNNMPLAPITEVNVVDTTAEIRAMRVDVVRAIKRIPQPIIHAERAWTVSHRQGHSFRNYLNRSI